MGLKPRISKRLAYRATSPALRITIIYALAGGAWILFSDGLLTLLVNDADTVARLQLFKGWFYVAVTTLLVFWLVRSHLRRRAAAVHALSVSEQRLDLALEGAGLGMWDWDLTTDRVVYCERWAAMLGYAPEEVEQTLGFWYMRIHLEDLDRVERALKEHCAGRTDLYEVSYRMSTSSGGWIWVQDRGRVVERGGRGQALRMVGTHLDITELKAEEDRRRTSEERFSQLAENIRAVFWMRDMDGRVLYLNPGYEAIFGRPAEALLNDPEDFFSALDPEDQGPVRQALAAMIEQGRPEAYDLEYRIHTKDGERWVWDKAFGVRDGRGRFIRFCGLCRDITERKLWEAEVEGLNRQLSAANEELARSNVELLEANQELLGAYEDLTTESGRRDQAEQNLHESEERFRATFDQAAVGLAHLTPSGRYTLVNKRLCEILGYTESELMKHNYQSLTHEKDLAATVGQVEEILARPGAVSRLDKRLYRKDGQVVWCRVTSTVVRDAEGRPRYFIDVVEDITEAREAAARTLRMAAALEHAGEAVAITDRNGAIQYVNEAFISQTGYGPEEALGRDPAFLRSDGHSRREADEELATLRAGRAWRGVLRLRAKDGREFNAETSVAPVLDEQGEIIHFVSIMRDVTTRMRLEERLRQTQKMEALGTLAGGISHDFNNLLTAIMGFAELAQRKNKNRHVARYLERILGAGRRGADMVRQILTFSRSREAAFSPVEFQAVARQALDLLEGAALSGIRVEQGLEAPGVLVMAEPSRLHQVVLNLCVNGLHAMRETGGVLTVTLKTVRDGPLGSESDPDHGESLLLTVRDTGTGMDEATRARVFEPFFTTKEPGEGTGMGLSVAHGIIAGWGGAIEVSSQPGRGSEFRVWLPVLDREDADSGENGRERDSA